jgi:hypothetical protein
LAAWLGVVALGLNSLVPVHLAFDLAEILGPPHRATAATGGLERRLIALACGHEEADGDHPGEHRGDRDHEHHHSGCPVCAAVGTLIAFAPAAAIVLPLPAAIAAAPAAIVGIEQPRRPPLAAYRSRAPPFA